MPGLLSKQAGLYIGAFILSAVGPTCLAVTSLAASAGCLWLVDAVDDE